MSMYLGRIHVRASLLVNLWAPLLGLHQWAACYQQVENVFRTKNSMRYVRYGALRIELCNDFQNIVFVVLTTHLFNQQTKYTADCTLKTAAAAARGGGAREVVSRSKE